MQDKIKHSTYTGTASDIRSKLQQAGYLVSANTLKSWAHRGKLTPVRKEGRHPIYCIADVYRLLLHLQQAGQTTDSVWQLLSEQKAN